MRRAISRSSFRSCFAKVGAEACSGIQEHLRTLQKPERHEALDTLNKIRQMSWNQRDHNQGLKPA
jgi:hypothetical protein